MHRQGPLRIRVPASLQQVDADGAFSFEIPLPSPGGAIGRFVDEVKALVLGAEEARKAGLASNGMLGDRTSRNASGRLDAAMSVLGTAFTALHATGSLEKSLLEPVGDKLGKVIVDRLKVRLRLNDARVAEILQGIDSAALGDAYGATAARVLGCLGDVLTLAFTPVSPAGEIG